MVENATGHESTRFRHRFRPSLMALRFTSSTQVLFYRQTFFCVVSKLPKHLSYIEAFLRINW